jgi:type I restriction enzyme S subunit
MIDATMNDGIAAFLNLDTRSNLYLYYFWLSKTRELRNINMGAAQPNLNTEIIKNYLVPYCSFEFQKAVVAEIESRLSVCDKIGESIEQNLKQSESLRQSILKKAFEGKLVPQDPNDEPPSVLLARIKAEREKDKPENPRRRQAGKIKTKKAKS